MILLIDFDKTLHDMDHPLPGKKMGGPLPGARDALLSLKAAKNMIYIFTTRATTPQGIFAVTEWMKHFEIPYDGVTAIKMGCDHYIDDKAIHFTNWREVLKQIGAYPLPEDIELENGIKITNIKKTPGSVLPP